MSKIKLKSNESGTGTLTIEAPNTNTDKTLTLPTSDGTLVTTDGATFTGNVNFGDNDKAVFGAGSDLQIYHDGSHSYVTDAGTGKLILQSNGDSLNLQSATDNYIICRDNAEVELYYNGAEKLATTSTGIDVTGTVTADGLDVSPSSGDASLTLTSNSSQPWKIYSPDASNALRFNSDSTDYLTIDTSGNVGIGTNSPLSVSGYTFTDMLGSSGAQYRVRTASVDLRVGVDTSTAFVSSTNSSLWFGTNNSEKMRINSSGNVGIGTTSPNVKLEIYDADPYIRLTDSVAPTGYSQVMGTFQGGLVLSADTSNSVANSLLRFDVDGSERMRITTSGNVGIGTTSPASKMTISSGVNTDTRTFLVDNAHSGGSMYNAFGVYVGASDRLVTLSADYGDSIMAFRTNGSEALRIKPDKRINAVNTNNPLGNLNLVGEVGIGYRCLSFERTSSGGEVGSIVANTSSTSYYTTSDYRLKENVVIMEGAIDRVKALQPKRFNFIADADTTVDGFLAHEVSDVVPEAISGEKDGTREEEYEVTPAVLDDDGNVVTEAVMGTRNVPDYQNIDQSKLVPLLTGALQEAIAKIEALETRIETLENP